MLEQHERDMFQRARSWINTPHGPSDDIWGIDGATIEPQDEHSYDTVFDLLLRDQGHTTFESLLAWRRSVGLETSVLDLFGSGFFVADYLDKIDSITGLRLKDPTAEMLANIQRNRVATSRKTDESTDNVVRRISSLRESPKWKTIIGSAYREKTWEDLDTSNVQRGIKSYGLVLVKPEVAFSEGPIFDLEDMEKSPTRDKIYSLFFLRMADRLYTRLSPHNGMLFSDVPHFIAQTYLDPFINILQSHEIKAKKFEGRRTQLKIVRTSDAPMSLEKLVERRFS